ncbi:MAG: sodium:proton antiporter [Candidatus Abyssubacteria bacterium]
MTEHILAGLAWIIVLGIGAQWLAWRFRLPAILLLLLFGFIAGALTGVLHPDKLLGDLLLPIVSLSVGIILFEGGLSLKLRELRETGAVIRNLLSIGVLVTWLVGAVAAHRFLGLDLEIAVLVGAILVVSGPTVIIPLLRQVRPAGQLASILKWEGILIDPIGATLAVLTYEAILQTELQPAAKIAIVGFLKTLAVGGTVGALAALLLLVSLRKYWIPDFLQNPVSLMAVVGTFTVANHLQTEAGLLATTMMGMILANQSKVPVKHIVEFKENLRVLLISGLFILLSARLRVTDMTGLGLESAMFLGALLLVARPLAVAVSTLGSELNWRERVFLSWVAPRGIVAAAVASVFALRLSELGHTQAEAVAPVTFLVIVSTVAIYGLTAAPVARLLRVAKANPQGVLVAGAHSWARDIAKALKEEGYEVLLVDTNRRNILRARMSGLAAVHGNILSESFLNATDLSGMSRILALTSNDEVNSLACLQFSDRFGRSEVYQLAPAGETRKPEHASASLRLGRSLFGPEITYDTLERIFAKGGTVKRTRLTEEFDSEKLESLYAGKRIPLFLIREEGDLAVFTEDNQPAAKPGQTMVSLITEPDAVGAHLPKNT